MQKFILILISICIGTGELAQNINLKEIKKNKIKSIIVSNAIGEKQLIFDTSGQLIKELHEGSIFIDRQIFYNSYQKPDSIISKADLSFLSYRQYFNYAPDSSIILITVFNDRTDTVFIGKNNEETKQQSPDGSSIKYEYNTKHQLIKQTAVDKEGKRETEQRVYNVQGNLIKKTLHASPGNTVTTTLTYNTKKLLIASTAKGTGGYSMANNHSTFEYNTKGLPVKELSVSGAFKNVATYTYEFY